MAKSMKHEKAYGLISIVIATILLTTFTTVIAVKAASTADMNNVATGSNNGGNTGNSTITPQAGSDMILTAIPTDAVVKPGADAGLLVTAHTDKNGTGIGGVDVQATYHSYQNHTEKIVLRGSTDKTGDFETKTQIPDDSKGQWLVLITADKPGFKHQEISTGFVVSKSSGKDSMGSDSGSSGSSGGGGSNKNSNSNSKDSGGSSSSNGNGNGNSHSNSNNHKNNNKNR